MSSQLNARQEAFCRGLAEGKPASRAYAEAGYDARGNAAEVNAARLLRKAQVTDRVRGLQAKAARKVEKTVETLVADLDRAIDMAVANKQTSAMVAAIVAQARLLGLITDKTQVEQVLHKPALLPGSKVELTEEEWRRQFDPNWNPDIH